MDLPQLSRQFPALKSILQGLIDGGEGKSTYRFRLTANRLRELGIESSLSQTDEWRHRLRLLAQDGWFDFKSAVDEGLQGSSLIVNAIQWQRLQQLFGDQGRQFLQRWPVQVDQLMLSDQLKDWLKANPPQPSWAVDLNWALALRRLNDLDCDAEYSGQQLSAFLFGHAKVIERSNRARDWSSRLGQHCGWRLVERGLLLHAHLPSEVTRIALIENQDTYLRLMDTFGDRLGLLFVAGNRAASERLVSRSSCRFGYTSGSKAQAIERFESFWFDARADQYELRYWGDLDPEGLAILARMQALLPTLRPWMAAYREMALLQPDANAVQVQADRLGELLEGGEIHQEAVLNLNQLEWD